MLVVDTLYHLSISKLTGFIIIYMREGCKKRSHVLSLMKDTNGLFFVIVDYISQPYG